MIVLNRSREYNKCFSMNIAWDMLEQLLKTFLQTFAALKFMKLFRL